MATVETVRGPVDVDDLGRDADARARLRPRSRGAPELRARVGRELLGRGGPRRGRDREAARCPGGRHRDDRRSDRLGLGRFVPRIQRVNAEVDLNIVVATGSTPSSSCRTSSATARPTSSPRSSCGRSARASTTPASGRRSQVRGRGVRDRRRRSDDRRRDRRREPRDRRADHGTHELGCATGLLALEAFAGEGVDPVPDRRRARRRLQRPRLPPGDRRRAARSSAATASASSTSTRSTDGSGRSSPRGRGVRRPDHPLARRRVLYDFFIGDEKFADEKPDYLLVKQVVFPLVEAGVTQEQIDAMTHREPAALLQQGLSGVADLDGRTSSSPERPVVRGVPRQALARGRPRDRPRTSSRTEVRELADEPDGAGRIGDLPAARRLEPDDWRELAQWLKEGPRPRCTGSSTTPASRTGPGWTTSPSRAGTERCDQPHRARCSACKHARRPCARAGRSSTSAPWPR